MKIITTLCLLFLYTITCAQFKVTGSPEKLAGTEGQTFLAPKCSPDGRFAAVTGANYKGLWIINLDSGERMQVTDEDAAGYGFTWSKDSKSILTRVAKFEGSKRYNAVKLFNIEAGSSLMISEYSTSLHDLPKWSSDNEKIYFYNKGNLEVHPSGHKALSKSSAQEKEIFLNENKLSSGIPGSGEFKPVDALKDQQCINMNVSPDGSKVVFEIYGGNLFVMNSDGTGLRDLGKGYRAAWSPDSRHVVYMISEDDGHQFTSSDLYVSSADGTEKQRLTTTDDKYEMDPNWSPDGTKIYYSEDREGAVYSISITRD